MRSWKLRCLLIAVPNNRFESFKPYLQQILPHVAIQDLSMLRHSHGHVIY